VAWSVSRRDCMEGAVYADVRLSGRGDTLDISLSPEDGVFVRQPGDQDFAIEIAASSSFRSKRSRGQAAGTL
jgi:hypothetical protein